MNTCFSSSLKPLFLQLFSKCRFTFCLVCGCYFRNVSCGAPPTYPALMCAHHTRINVHARAPHPALNHSPQSFHCLSMENLGFWLVVLSPHSTSSTACFFSTCLDWGENFFFKLILIRAPFRSGSSLCQNTHCMNKREQLGGSSPSPFILRLANVIDFIMFFFELFNNAHTILIDRISLDNTENVKNCCMHASKDFLHLYKEKMCFSTVAMLMNRTCQAIS